MFRSTIAGILTAALSFAPVAQACTGIRFVAKDGSIIAARSLEFGFDLHSDVMVVAAVTMFTGTLPDGGKGISYKTKYGFVGANAEGMPAIVDGINEAGLYVGLFYFPDYASYGRDQRQCRTRDGAARIRQLAAWQFRHGRRGEGQLRQSRAGTRHCRGHRAGGAGAFRGARPQRQIGGDRAVEQVAEDLR